MAINAGWHLHVRNVGGRLSTSPMAADALVCVSVQSRRAALVTQNRAGFVPTRSPLYPLRPGSAKNGIAGALRAIGSRPSFSLQVTFEFALMRRIVLFGFFRSADLGQQYDTVSRAGGNFSFLFDTFILLCITFWFIPPRGILLCVGPHPKLISGSSLRGVVTRADLA